VVANAPLRVPAVALGGSWGVPWFGRRGDWIAQQARLAIYVVTADIPLAARCLAKEARVLEPKGDRSRKPDHSALAMP